MTQDSILVLDAGSSSIRCHLLDFQSRILRSVSRPWTYLHEPDAPELARAFNPNACWQSVKDAIADCIQHTPDTRPSISAVAVTSQRQSLAFLDESGAVIYAGPNTDLRAIFDGFALDSRHGSLISAATGRRPTFMTAPGKLAWFRDHRPHAYSRIAHVLTLADWLVCELTGNLDCERTLASESGLTGVSRPDTPSPIFGLLGLDCPLPRLLGALETRGVASNPELGVPVINAGPDTQCGLIGMGIAAHGSAGIVAGWSATVQLLSSNETLSPDTRTWSGLFQLPKLRTIESNAGDMGNALQWLANLLFLEASDPYRAVDEAARTVAPGSDGVSAFLGPQAMDASSLGMKLGGLTFPVPMTLGGPTRGQIARAALESFAYALRANLERAECVAGFQAEKLALGGGMTRSPAFARIVTDVLGRKIALSKYPDATPIGAALTARTAIGQYPSLPEAAAPQFARNTTLKPDPLHAAEYEDRYEAWLQTQRALDQMPM